MHAWPRAGWMAHSPFPSRLLMPPQHGMEALLLIWLALTVFAGAFVVVDIAYNVMTVSALGLFVLFGLRLDRANVPLILFLSVYNIGGLIALQPYLSDDESRAFMLGTCYVAVTAAFFAMILNENAIARLEALKWGLIAGALIAATTGILGYARIAGLEDYFTMHGGRAKGTFRDPNVLGPFLVLPALFLAQDMIRGKSHLLLRAGMFSVIVLALFLTFSRGAWASLVIGMLTLMVVSALTSTNAAMRARLGLFVILGLAAAAMGFAAILSVDSIYELFADRFVLQKDYDSGPSGRFGSQLRSLPDLLTLPFGHGPNRFSHFYPENPHNTYIMAFSSYGWLGGLAFLGFILATLLISIKTLFLRTPFQPYVLVIFSALIPHLVQNFQIDTDRWRHLFMIYGLSWGLAAISRRWIGEYRAYAHQSYREQANLRERLIAEPAE
jgi:O-antigen ligase